MAKALIYVPYVKADEWCAGPFPEHSLAGLPVCGKPWVEYVIDRAANLGMDRVLVLDYEYSPALARHLTGDGRERWPLKLTYTGAGLFASEGHIRGCCSAFIDNCETEIVTGPRFPVGDEWRLISSVREYHALNFELLSDPRGASLPGYSCEPGVWVGENVQIKTGCKLTAPAVLGDDIRLDHGCHVSGGAIICDGALVDEESCISRTIVFPNTYIGRKTDFTGKIVTANRVIDGETGAWVDLSDYGISDSVYRCDHFGLSALEWILALSLAIVFALPYLLCMPFRRKFSDTLWAYKLSADRYPGFWRVLAGRSDLVRFRGSDWVFHPSDGLTRGRTATQRKLDEDYYNYNRTARLILDVVVKGLVNRIFSNDWARHRDLIASRGRRNGV